jgi:DNA polymerase-2
MSSLQSGFIVTRNWRDTDQGVELELWLSTDEGPRSLVVGAQEAVFFLPVTDRAQACELIGTEYSCRVIDLELKDFQQQPVAGFYFRNQRQLRRARDCLEEAGMEPLEADINPVERYLMERFVTGSLEYGGTGPALRVKAADYQPRLKMLSIDIETAMGGLELFSIAAYGEWEGKPVRKVFMCGEGADLPYVTTCLSERALLGAFCDWLQEYDPDVLIGWNVVNFDLWFLQRLADKLRMRLPLGRARRQPHWRELDDEGERRAVQLSGRAVIDGIEMLRTATYRFESFSLENVSRELLGAGKLLHGSGRGEQIGELFQQDKNQLAEYNLRDCELVWQIFEHTKLLEFSVARSQMTGLALDRLGGSVAAFDFLYLPQLHRAGYVAPNASAELLASPGGFVLDSQPGIYDNVLVLDFKSLYPSIIRTFFIDPLGLALGIVEDQPAAEVLEGFAGGRFSRRQHVLPQIIEQLWQRRDAAKARGDGAQSQAIKIIMNSFYGVLGSPGCRFFDARLASSITRRGHQIIQQTRDRIEQLGDKVIYGDTDSVFVWVKSSADVDPDQRNAQAEKRGRWLQEQLNQWWDQRLQDEFGIESVLELEFETHYRRFLMPTVRGSEKGSKKRYAGVVENNGELELVFKGLEKVRTDWTTLARRFQGELYRRVFFDEPYRDFILETVAQVEAGELDAELVYRKRLRRRLDDYEKNIPPHVQAARLQRQRSGVAPRRGDWVEYLITMQGAEPVGAPEASLDYQHYIEKQLAPVADGILHFDGSSFAEITGRQISLF